MIRGVEQGEVGVKIGLGGDQVRKTRSHIVWVERKTLVLLLDQGVLWSLHNSSYQRRCRSDGQVISIKRPADGRRQRSRKIIDKKREKYGAKNRSFPSTWVNPKGATFL